MKYISWNVNGIRAAVKKGFIDFFNDVDADFFCIQESKLQEGQIDLSELGYYQYWNYASKKGYSGTAIFAKEAALHVQYGIGVRAHDDEGRVITLEYPTFYLVNVYTPNAKRDLSRLSYRMEWEDAFCAFVVELDRQKPVIVCGDLNVAHHEIDLKNPQTNRKNAGFTPEERGKMTTFLESGFIDSFRHLNPDVADCYTWWSYMAKARERNIGWRIDYFCVSARLEANLQDAMIYPEVHGSDHCPVGIVLEI